MTARLPSWTGSVTKPVYRRPLLIHAGVSDSAPGLSSASRFFPGNTDGHGGERAGRIDAEHAAINRGRDVISWHRRWDGRCGRKDRAVASAVCRSMSGRSLFRHLFDIGDDGAVEVILAHAPAIGAVNGRRQARDKFFGFEGSEANALTRFLTRRGMSPRRPNSFLFACSWCRFR